jgi:hypothetical protein
MTHPPRKRKKRASPLPATCSPAEAAAFLGLTQQAVTRYLRDHGHAAFPGAFAVAGRWRLPVDAVLAAPARLAALPKRQPFPTP